MWQGVHGCRMVTIPECVMPRWTVQMRRGGLGHGDEGRVGTRDATQRMPAFVDRYVVLVSGRLVVVSVAFRMVVVVSVAFRMVVVVSLTFRLLVVVSVAFRMVAVVSVAFRMMLLVIVSAMVVSLTFWMVLLVIVSVAFRMVLLVIVLVDAGMVHGPFALLLRPKHGGAFVLGPVL